MPASFRRAYHLARFHVAESADLIRIGVLSRDGAVSLSVAASSSQPACEQRPEFASTDEATGFFRRGALGFSPSVADGCMDGVRLDSTNWAAIPMTISAMSSNLFEDAAAFPDGTCTLDSAMLMTNIIARWTAEPLDARPLSRAA